MASAAAEPAPLVSVGAYLARRLVQLGSPHVFGLPGDFNLTLLDEMLSVDGTVWVGTTNELNAAYAADGYARVRRAPTAVVTTYGVGELSAINGVAGSFAEDVPVVAVTGMPASASMRDGVLMHHTLVDGDAGHFVRAYDEVVQASAVLRAADAPFQLDRVLRTAITTSKPVYLGVPADVADLQVSSAPLRHPLVASASDPAAVAAFREALTGWLGGATRVTVLAGTQVHRVRAEAGLAAVAGHPGVEVATLAGAKAVLPETHAASLGTYMGAMTTSPAVREVVDDAERLVLAGTVFSDVLTGIFSQRFDERRAVHLGLHHARVGGSSVDGVRLVDAVAVLDEVLGELLDDAPDEAGGGARTAAARTPAHGPVRETTDARAGEDDGPLTQAELWRQVQEWLPEDAFVAADAGTALYGCLPLSLPSGTELLAQPIWSAIGYTLPATLGLCLAAPERLSVLFIGDGAAQLTATELATIWQRGLTPVVVLVDNAGYTIERVIQNPTAGYHDVTAWEWTALPAALAPDAGVVTASATTPAELRSALRTAREATGRSPVLLRVQTAPDDAPPLLAALGAAVAARTTAGSSAVVRGT